MLERPLTLGAETPPDAPALVDQGRLARIVDDHFDAMWRFMRRLGLAESDLDDATQEVILVLSRRLDQIGPASERSFVLSTSFRVTSEFRRRARRRRETDDAALIELPSRELGPEDSLERKRLRQVLDRVLDQLPLELRAVFVLYELEELTMAEIAVTLSLPPGTVASRLRRARATCQQLASAALPDEESP